MSAGVEEERVRLVVRSGFGGVNQTVAHVFFRIDSTIDNAIGQVDEVGSEWESPGACYCCNGGVSVWMRLGNWRGLTEHLRDRDPNTEGGTHGVGACCWRK